MRRREFITLIGGAAASWPLGARAQTAIRTIGWLSVRSFDTEVEAFVLAAFREGMAQTGYVEGKNLMIEFRFGDGQYDRVPALVADLIQRQVAALVTSGGTQIARLAQAATKTTPIVFATASDPVQDGLVKSLNRPGGNSTGAYLLNNSLASKRLEVLHALVPNARVIAFLVNPNNLGNDTQIREARSAANSIGIQLQVFNAGSAGNIDAAFSALAERGAGALLMGADPLFQVEQKRVIALAASHKIPAIYEWPEFVKAGGLATYCVDRSEAWRQLGVYVSRILNGAKPADLPVIQPTKFELVINLKTAKALSLAVPPTLLTSADEVIE
jgi:putative tryptophan/tyrosine transport system substrate-binding protein